MLPRREFLRGLSALGVFSLAGCSDDGEGTDTLTETTRPGTETTVPFTVTETLHEPSTATTAHQPATRTTALTTPVTETETSTDMVVAQSDPDTDSSQPTSTATQSTTSTTTTTPTDTMTDQVFWQDGDAASPTNLSRLRAQTNSSDYVERGVSFTPDYANNQLDISTGHAVIYDESTDRAYDVFPDARTNLALTDAATNYVFLMVDPDNITGSGVDDDVGYHIDTDDTPPTSTETSATTISVKVGEVDTTADTKTTVNRDPAVTARAVDTESLSTTVQSDGVSIRGAGTGISRSDFFDVSGGLTKKHDLLNDSANRVKAATASGTVGNTWAAAGGGSILEDNGTYYIALRQRGDANAGYRWDIYSNSGDLLTASNWSQEWTLLTSNVANRSINSIEAVSIRKFGGTFYLYVCDQNQGWENDGTISVVSADTISGLKTQLSDGNNWTRVISGEDPGYNGAFKDPAVHELNGDYYMLAVNNLTVGNERVYLLRSETGPEFSEYTILGEPTAPYFQQFGTDTGVKCDTILYDQDDDRFVAWGMTRHGTDIYWFWTSSKNLVDWRWEKRELAFSWGRDSNATARYFDYHQLDDQRSVIIMEWDDDGDGSGDMWVWDYSSDTAGSTSTSATNIEYRQPAQTKPAIPQSSTDVQNVANKQHTHTGDDDGGATLSPTELDVTGDTQLFAWLSTNQSLTAGTQAKIAFDSIDTDNRGEWDSVNTQFVADRGGVYLVTSQAMFTSAADGDSVRLTLFKNGSGTSNEYDITGAAKFISVDSNAILFLSAGDSVSVHAQNADSADALQGQKASTYLKIVKVA